MLDAAALCQLQGLTAMKLDRLQHVLAPGALDALSRLTALQVGQLHVSRHMCQHSGAGADAELLCLDGSHDAGVSAQLLAECSQLLSWTCVTPQGTFAPGKLQRSNTATTTVESWLP